MCPLKEPYLYPLERAQIADPGGEDGPGGHGQECGRGRCCGAQGGREGGEDRGAGAEAGLLLACKTMASWAISNGFWPSCYVLFGVQVRICS